MSAASPCVPCCSTPQSVNIPGLEGEPGDNGTNGISAFSITTTQTVVPIPTVTVNVDVNSTLWMVIGQIVIVGQGVGAGLAGPGPSTFKVDSIPSATVVSLEYLGYAGDVAPGGGNTLSTGCIISPAGDALLSPLAIANGGTGASVVGGVGGALQNLGLGYTPITVYGAGTAFTVPSPAFAQITLGTTSPITTLTALGTYLIFYRCRIDFQAATFPLSVFTLQLEKLNNGGPNPLTSNSNASMIIPVIGVATTYSLDVVGGPQVYVNADVTNQIGLYAKLTIPPSAGDLQISECEIVAVKLF